MLFSNQQSRDTLFNAFVLPACSACKAQKWCYLFFFSFIDPYCSVEISGVILFLILSMITWCITLVTWFTIDIIQKFSQSTAPDFFGRVIKVDL